MYLTLHGVFGLCCSTVESTHIICYEVTGDDAT